MMAKEEGAMDVLGGIGNVQTAYGLLGACYQGVQKHRLKVFLLACKQSLQSEGELAGKDEGEFLKWFRRDFGKKQLYDFIRQAIENNSLISRLALARIFSLNNSKGSVSLSFDDTVFVRCLTSQDDVAIRTLIRIFGFKKNGRDVDFLEARQRPDGSWWTYFKLDSDEFMAMKDELVGVGCKAIHDVQLIMRDFSNRGLLHLMPSGVGKGGSGCFCYTTDDRFEKFIELCRWAEALSLKGEMKHEFEAVGDFF